MPSFAPLVISISFCFFAGAIADQPLPPYTNHTVGDAAGWFFNAATNTSSANYSTWAANQIFNLGDFLIFRTNTNQTVIQTYNQTTYEMCSIDEDPSNQTTIYSEAPDQTGRHAVVAVPVPLTKVGKNFFFSNAYDGIQCDRGMRFEILVGQGRGLPPSLNHPTPPPPASPPPDEAPPSETNQGQTFYNGAASPKWRFGFQFVLGIPALLLLFSSADFLPPFP